MPTEALYRALKQEWGEDSRFANWNDEKGFKHYVQTLYDYDKLGKAKELDKASKILLGVTILINLIDVCKVGAENPDNADEVMKHRLIRNAFTLGVSYIAGGLGAKTGQWLGSMVGSKLGGAAGGAAGTAIAPGPGTAAGTVGGAALGSAIGASLFGTAFSFGFSYLSVKACDYLFEKKLGW